MNLGMSCSFHEVVVFSTWLTLSQLLFVHVELIFPFLTGSITWVFNSGISLFSKYGINFRAPTFLSFCSINEVTWDSLWLNVSVSVSSSTTVVHSFRKLMPEFHHDHSLDTRRCFPCRFGFYLRCLVHGTLRAAMEASLNGVFESQFLITGN